MSKSEVQVVATSGPGLSSSTRTIWIVAGGPIDPGILERELALKLLFQRRQVTDEFSARLAQNLYWCL